MESEQPPEAPRLAKYVEPPEGELSRWFARVKEFFDRPNRIHYCPHCREQPLHFHMEFTLTPRDSSLWMWCERCMIALFLTGPAER